MFHVVIPTADRNPAITLANVGSVVRLIVSTSTITLRINNDLRLWSDMFSTRLNSIFIPLSSAYPCG